MTHRLFPLLMLAACAAPSQADLDATRGGRVDAYFNAPGTRPGNQWDPDAIDVMVDLIDHANASIRVAVMGFNREALVDAFERAYDRGVDVQMVGDASHLGDLGYERFRDRHIPIVTGNMAHIMHDKFMVIDERLVMGSTANWTDSDLAQNVNNFFVLDSPNIAADFTAEWTLMFDGVFGANKTPQGDRRVYTVGDTTVEVWFAPQEDAMGRILELVDGAKESVRFSIFAMTKDELGSSLLRKQTEFARQNAADGPLDGAGLDATRTVAGVIDQSQLHSNGQYHEVYRMLGAGIPLRMDGNDNSVLPGDYQAGGGRLHAKTMVIDANGDDPTVITGSFNWSSSATQSNDEYMLVMHGKRVAGLFQDAFDTMWFDGRPMGVDRVADGAVKPGDVVINEVQWYGAHQANTTGSDEFLELRNLTDHDIRLDLWSLQGASDFVVGIPPGMVIPANGLFLMLDHVLEPYTDGEPQDQTTAYRHGDMVLNVGNDDRLARLSLKDAALTLRLIDPDAVQIDAAGDGGPAFVGGPTADARVRSMERNDEPGDGTQREAWHACTLETGGANVNDDYQDEILGTPGEANSPR